MIPALIIAVMELIENILCYQNGMPVPAAITGYLRSYFILHQFVYICVLAGCFPLAWLMFIESGIPLRSAITSIRKFIPDLAFGLIAGTITFAISYFMYHIVMGIPLVKSSGSIIILRVVSLTLFSGFFKEILFRGIPFIFLKNQIGEFPAFMCGNILFAVLDWPNMGISFIYGTIWYLFYRKRGSLLVPVTAHGFHNLMQTLAVSGGLAFIGIIPH